MCYWNIECLRSVDLSSGQEVIRDRALYVTLLYAFYFVRHIENFDLFDTLYCFFILFSLFNHLFEVEHLCCTL